MGSCGRRASRRYIFVFALAACGQRVAPSNDGGADAPLGSYSIGGMVTMLNGTGLVLQNDNGDDLPISANGTFTFATKLHTGDTFSVSIKTQPDASSCAVSGGTGTVGTMDVSSVTVNCSNKLFTIGGTVTGVIGAAILSNPLTVGTDRVTISADGTYAFPTSLPVGTSFHVTVDTQPTASTCYVTGPTASPGIGTVPAMDVTNVDVRCVGQPTMSAIASSCNPSNQPIQWTDVPGASFTLSYGPIGNLTTVEVAAGTTTFTPAIGPGDYIAHVQAHVGTMTGPVSADMSFHVRTTPTVYANNTGPSCLAGTVYLVSSPSGAASYAWTGPGGYTSTAQNPTLNNVGGSGGAATGAYTVTITAADGCSATATTNVATSSVAGTFTQTTTTDFNANTNWLVTTANNQVSLADDLDVGAGTTAYGPGGNTTLPSGSYDFTDFTIPAGVTVTVTGIEPLLIRATGTVRIAGILDARGHDGTSGVTLSSAGVGGAGIAHGGDGGDGYYGPTGPFDGRVGSGQGGGPQGTGWNGGGGGGHATVGGAGSNGATAGGAMYGAPAFILLDGGSGGGGGSGGNNCGSGGGGGGGGAVQFSATTITVSGSILVDGGNGGSDGGGGCGGGGGGSGGNVRLRARNLTVSGTISANGGTGGSSSRSSLAGNGAVGRIRFDSGASSITGTVTPAAGFNGGLFSTPGWTRTVAIAPAKMCKWGVLTFTTSQPASTAATVSVLDALSNVVLLSNVASGTDISSTVTAGTQISLVAELSTTAGATPALLDWTLGYTTR